MVKKKHIILFVDFLPPGAAESVRRYSKEYKVLLLRDLKKKNADTAETNAAADILVYVDFSKSHKIAEALLPYQDTLLAVTARGDASATKLSQVIPHVPYLRTPTRESLEWTTDKYEMRKRMRLFDKKNTPRFTKVKDNTKNERQRIIEKVHFPMVVKPANLQGSALVTICYHEEELEKALRNVFRKLKKQYSVHDRTQLPTIIAEEYMEGDMYSIDVHVNSRGIVYFCPMVRVLTGRDAGRDDFYLYLQMTPTNLKRETIERAHAVVETNMHALGLRNTSAHVELMKIDDVWKIIEIGPRVGGFRDRLHKLSCDIDHNLNDVLIRIPKKPILPKKCKGFAAILKWFPEKEGKITRLKGIKKIREISSFVEIVVNKKIGDQCRFSKNGGKAVFVLTLYNAERAKLLADIRRVEKLVDIQVGR